tara:strand:- start:151 stop:351 length:201 start_codon:yes stop_codon:yes gene_type:complete
MKLKDIKGEEPDEITLPKTVNQLITLLNDVYPEKSPDINDDLKTMSFKAGQRDVVRFINLLKERDS